MISNSWICLNNLIKNSWKKVHVYYKHFIKTVLITNVVNPSRRKVKVKMLNIFKTPEHFWADRDILEETVEIF